MLTAEEPYLRYTDLRVGEIMEEVFGYDPVFDSATIRFVQDGNTVGTTSQPELLEISLVTQLPGEEPFIVLRSESGWSISDISEIEKLIEQCLRITRE